ncbi:LOW QUALITY PROTEIN: Gag-Pol polyprotein [Plecturocebus cupreus]
MTSSWTTNRFVDLGNGTVTHSFLVIPECPYPLLGQDLFHKLQANISFGEGQACLSIPPSLASGPPQQILITCALSDKYLLQEALSSEADQPPTSDLLCQFQKNVPGVRAETNSPGLASHCTLVVLLATATLVQVRQYPVSQEARQGIAPHITRLPKGRILTTCESPWNTPLLPVLKPGTKDCRPVQDLREVNKQVETVHPTVPNPYTLLSLLGPEHHHYTVLDLKDAFFCIPLASPPLHCLGSQRCILLHPTGLLASPYLLLNGLTLILGFWGNSLGQDCLRGSKTPLLCLIRHLAKILPPSELSSPSVPYSNTVSAKKAQLCQPKVTYLGYIIERGNRALAPSRVQAVLQIPTPTTKRQVQEFLRVVGYCRLWILRFTEIAKPLYACTRGNQPLTWTETEQRAFDKLKTTLTTVPTLALPDISKPFWLFVHEKQGVAKGVLTQTLGPWSRPVAYLSKRLDPIAAGWPACLRSVAATALLVKEADKLTLGQELNLVATHMVESLLCGTQGKWMSNACIVSSISGLTFGPAPHKIFKGYSFKLHHAATRQRAGRAHT